MNKSQRKQLNEQKEQLEEIKSKLESMKDEEEEKFGNMPEGLQESERGEAMQFAIDQLEEVSTYLQDSIDAINEIIGG